MYVPSTRKIISSYDVVFDVIFSSALTYTLQPCSEAMTIRPAVTYTPCAASLREQTGNIITFAQFEEGNILSKARTMQKAVTNPMTIQLFHRDRGKKKLMPWILVMSQIMILNLREC